MRIAVIGTRGAWSTEGLAAALRFAGCAVPVMDLSLCSLRLPDPRLHYRGVPVEGLDGAVVKKIGDTAGGWAVRERINLLRQLESTGVRILSEPDRLEVAVDRYRMTLELTRAGLPTPDTVLTEDIDEAMATVERFGAAVLKPLFTSKGRGMERLDAHARRAHGPRSPPGGRPRSLLPPTCHRASRARPRRGRAGRTVRGCLLARRGARSVDDHHPGWWAVRARCPASGGARDGTGRGQALSASSSRASI